MSTVPFLQTYHAYTLNKSEDAMEIDDAWNESPHQPVVEDTMEIDDTWNESPQPVVEDAMVIDNISY